MSVKKFNELDETLRGVVQKFNKAYEKGDESFFNYFRSDALIYPVNSAEPCNSLDEYMNFFTDYLKQNSERKFELLDFISKPIGDQTLVLQTAKITQENVIVHVRQSIIWDQIHGSEWRISHLNSSVVGNSLLKNPDSISKSSILSVISEKISGVASTVGVAQ